MSELRVATRYAKSIFDLAIEKNILDEVEKDAQLFLKTIEESRAFENMLRSPIITTDKKLTVIRRLFKDDFNKVTFGFIDIVMRKKREIILKNIFSQFVEMYKEHKGIITATVTTAVPITEKIKDDIRKMLHNKTHSTIDLKTMIDSDLLGGFVLHYEDKLVDASVASQLKSLKNHLLNNN